MSRVEEMQGLADAAKILDAKRMELVLAREASAIYAIVYHAYLKVNERLSCMLRGEDQ